MIISTVKNLYKIKSMESPNHGGKCQHISYRISHSISVILVSL